MTVTIPEPKEISWYPADQTRSCVQVNEIGLEWEEISCIYPWLQKIYFKWEYEWQPEGLFQWMVANSWFPYTCVAFYLVAIYLGQKYMENRSAYNFKKTLAVWNLLLAVFSLLGVTRTLPQLVHNVSTYGFYNWLCTNPRNMTGPGSTGIWLMFFVFSKPAELLDTFFLIVHKKKVITLHWYHHATVLLASWQTFTTLCPPGLIYCSMNYAVHSVMYLYYFLQAIGKKPKWFNPMTITVTQIAQMVVGTYVSASAFHAMQMEGCWAKFENNSATLAMYVSYLVLFLQFFIRRYGFGSSTQKDSKKQMLKKD